MRTEIYQIFYDHASRAQVEPGFIALSNERDGGNWYEFRAIKDFLEARDLQKDILYAFLSPKFKEKTGHCFESINLETEADSGASDVFLFSHGWDQLCFFKNPWEQAEAWHKGVAVESQRFFNSKGININVGGLVTCRRNSVFSNFILAKSSYWEEWLSLARQFSDYCNGTGSFLEQVGTRHRGALVPLKVMIQERFPTVILSQNEFKTVVVDNLTDSIAPFFVDTPENRLRLLDCDAHKQKFCFDGQKTDDFEQYIRDREAVLLT